jgi:hypothetical protein
VGLPNQDQWYVVTIHQPLGNNRALYYDLTMFVKLLLGQATLLISRPWTLELSMHILN